MEYQYYELRYYNDTNSIQEATLQNDRFFPILDTDLDWEVSVIRFDASTTRVPCFIPRIEKSKHDIFSDSNGLLWNNFTQQPTSWDDLRSTGFPTNLQIMVQYTDNSDPSAPKNKLLGETVCWLPENLNEAKPIDINRESVFKSRYFHCYNNLHPAELIALALDSCLDKMCIDLGISVSGNTEIDTLDGKTILLIPTALATGDTSKRFDIIFNQDLKLLYGFRTTPHPTIINAHILRRTGDEQQITTGYTPQKSYVSIPEVFSSTAMFPYKSIVFTSNSLPVEPMKRFNNIDNENNASVNVITDYLLSVDDINAFYDVLAYQPQSYGRKIMLNSNNIRNRIEITPMLESSDGLQSKLYIPPEGSCSVVLLFTAQRE